MKVNPAAYPAMQEQLPGPYTGKPMYNGSVSSRKFVARQEKHRLLEGPVQVAQEGEHGSHCPESGLLYVPGGQSHVPYMGLSVRAGKPALGGAHERQPCAEESASEH